MTSAARTSLLLLVLATAGVMLWHELGMDRHLVIDSGTELPVAAYDDRAIGGESVARLEREDDAIVMRCDIREAVDWPYCQLVITLQAPPAGVDLSRYDTVRLDLDVGGPGGSSVRLHLRNFDAGSSRLEDYTSLRVNEIEYSPDRVSSSLEVPLDYFEVPAWWRGIYAASLADSRPRLDNVSHVEILTGPFVREGEHVATLHAIRFSGKWIRRDLLYLGILATWMLAVLGYLTAGVAVTRRRVREARERQRELEGMNQVLQLQSDELRQQAHRDPLTGALNRVGLRELLRGRIDAVRSGRSALSLVLLDIDHFKRINDVYGHGVGDEVLRRFAQRVAEKTRPNDHLVRWGGEEFVLVCTGTVQVEAAHVAQKLRAMIAGESWPHGEPLTCSFGLGQLADGEPIGDFLERIDQALYRAKTKGRDRVEIAYERGERRPVAPGAASADDAPADGAGPSRSPERRLAP